MRSVEMPQPNVTAQVKACWERATECERRALLATDDAQRKTYLELVGLWRDMAQQVEMLHRQSSSQQRPPTEL
jgi:hypothetical protein